MSKRETKDKINQTDPELTKKPENQPSKDTLTETDAALENYTRMLQFPLSCPLSGPAPSPTKLTPADEVRPDETPRQEIKQKTASTLLVKNRNHQS